MKKIIVAIFVTLLAMPVFVNASPVSQIADSVGGAGEKVIDSFQGQTRIENTKMTSESERKGNLDIKGDNVNYTSGGISVSHGSNIKNSKFVTKSKIKGNTNLKGNNMNVQEGGINIK